MKTSPLDSQGNEKRNKNCNKTFNFTSFTESFILNFSSQTQDLHIEEDCCFWGVSVMIHQVAQELIDPLHSCISLVENPMQRTSAQSWKPFHLFKGSTSILHHLSCHASQLVPGFSPHPPHCHEDEEILIMLSGSADLIFKDPSASQGEKRVQLVPGQWVYYPSGFAHTIEATGSHPATYLMIRWTGPKGNYGDPLPFQKFDIRSIDNEKSAGQGFRVFPLMAGPTSGLRKLEGHVSSVDPGGGYDPHTDCHDVLLYVLEGEVETLGRRVGPRGVIFYRAGEPHGLGNPGDIVATYLVFEFHGSNIPLTQSWPFRFIGRSARLFLPPSIRTRIGRILGRLGRRLGGH